jgi:hypothetical protein
MRRTVSTLVMAWFLATVNASFVLHRVITAPYLRGPVRVAVDGGRFV